MPHPEVDPTHDAGPGAPPARRPWVAPVLTELPPLVQLTLQTGIGVDCTPDDPSCTFGVLPGRRDAWHRLG